MIYEIMNPSDVYTCIADDPKVAFATILYFGSGQLGGGVT